MVGMDEGVPQTRGRCLGWLACFAGGGVCGESVTLVGISYVGRNAQPHSWPGEKDARHPPAKNRGQYVYVVIQKPWGQDRALPSMSMSFH